MGSNEVIDDVRVFLITFLIITVRDASEDPVVNASEVISINQNNGSMTRHKTV